MNIKERIIKLIQQSRVKEAISAFLRWSENHQPALIPELSLIASKFEKLSDDFGLSMIDYDTYNREHGKSTAMLMRILEKIEIGKDNHKKSKTILFLAANPVGTEKLELEKELVNISHKIQTGKTNFQLFHEWALKIDDLQHSILKYKPDIIHFSGHGSSNEQGATNQRSLSLRQDESPLGGIYLLGDDNRSQFVHGMALAELFSILHQRFPIKAVVLNACYSKGQAEEIIKFVPYVIGMRKAIGDSSAIAFSIGFYNALSLQDDIPLAFEMAKSRLNLAGNHSKETPILLINNALLSSKVENNDTEE